MSAHYEEDVRMKRNKLLPDLLTVIISSAEVVTNARVNVRACVNVTAAGYVVKVKVTSVIAVICVGRDYYSAVGISDDHVICPCQDLIARTEVNGEEEIIGSADSDQLIRVSYIALGHKVTAELIHILLSGKVLVEVL